MCYVLIAHICQVYIGFCLLVLHSGSSAPRDTINVQSFTASDNHQGTWDGK